MSMAQCSATAHRMGREWRAQQRAICHAGMNLAAAFGPVEGLTTEIVFTDLLGLETGPLQQLQRSLRSTPASLR